MINHIKHPEYLKPLLDELPDTFSDADREFVMRAFKVAADAHDKQTRVSGEPYISHCSQVAIILAKLRVPPTVIAAGLLHDTVEDTPLTLDDLRQDFGEDVARLVNGVTKLTDLPRVSRGDQHADEEDRERAERELAEIRGRDYPVDELQQLKKTRKFNSVAETLRKIFLAMGEDPLVPLVKLADRLHNMRTMSHMPEHKRMRIAQETLDIFAPLANRLGIWNIKWELEDLSFRYVNPVVYKEIAEKLTETRSAREEELRKIVIQVKHILAESGINADVSGRPKHIYSIYRKMLRKEVPFEQVHDVRGIRVLVPEITDCYMALGLLHNHPGWRPITREFDDYIAAPKDNFYKSLHTAVVYEDGKQLEIQIRTLEMHQDAEYGIAAHWRYKEGKKHDEEFNRRVLWLRKMLAASEQDSEDTEGFVENVKGEMMGERVYALTPKGDVIDLPQGSTPIDFAYHVHTEVGHRCRGAKVNGKLSSLDTTLRTGDIIQILTAKRGGPSRDWLNESLGLVLTDRAKNKIRYWFRVQAREQNITIGREMLDRELRRLGRPDTNLEKLGGSFQYKTVEDLSVAIGNGEMPLSRIANYFSLDETEVEDIRDYPLPIKEPARKDETPDGNGIAVLGLKGLLTSMAKCCNPAPGDKIVGYITRGRGATIHRKDCPNALRIRDTERVVQVSWGSPKNTYPVAVRIRAYDRAGLARDISGVIAEEKVSILEGTIKSSKNVATLDLVIEVEDVPKLSRILHRIEALPNVQEARRITG